MDLGIAGKRALVTGASSGLGKAAALALGMEGVRLAICARREPELREVARELTEKTGLDVYPIPGDISTAEGIEAVYTEARTRFGGVDILVNNTGGPPTGTFLELDHEAWQKAVNQLLFSAVGITRLALPGMKESRWGRIITITSIAVKQPIDNLMLSNSIRAAVTGFTRTLANEVASFGITVNNVLPGFTKTERLSFLAQKTAEINKTTLEQVYEGWESRIPAGRLGRPDEIGDCIAFLASEKASYITGTSIPIDGGYVRGLL